MRCCSFPSRPTILAAALLVLFPVVSQASGQGPTLRILSSRSATTESASSDVVFERAGAGGTMNASGAAQAQVPGAPASKALQAGSASGAGARPSSAQPATTGLRPPATPKLTVGRPPAEPGSVEDRRIRALNRVAAMNQATGPRDAGVPQSPGTGPDSVPPPPQGSRPMPAKAPAKGPANPAPPPSKLLSERAPRAQVAAAQLPSAKPVAPIDKPKTDLSPVPGKASPDGDPLASEIAREGEHYFFTGSVNGLPVRFRINDDISGIRMPTRIATVAKALPPGSSNVVASKGEVLAPIHTISFGAYPVRSVMVKIYPDDASEFVDIGYDALANFKIKSVNGRRLLVKS